MGYAFFIRPEPLVAVRDHHAAECVSRTFERQALPLSLHWIAEYFGTSKIFVGALTTEYTEMYFVRRGRRFPKGNRRTFQPK